MKIHLRNLLPFLAVFLFVRCLPAQPAGMSDTEVMVTAVEQTTPTSATNLPDAGNFYSAQHLPDSAQPWPPLPGNVVGLPAWPLGDGTYLLDDRDYHWHHRSGRSQTATASLGGMATMDVSLSPVDDGDDDTNDDVGGGYVPVPLDTNGLWLEITNVSGGLADLNLHNATNLVYEILSRTNLADTAWTIEMELWPTATNSMPFTVPTYNRQNLFLKAADWTGITSSGNTTPDWWFYYYYGTTALSDTNLDSQENTLAYDYANNLDPNVIQFSLEVTNDYVNDTTVPVTLNITAGTPSYCAVLVNSTMTNWLPFTTANLSVYLGMTDGVYNVSVGLKGLPANATQTWQSETFFKDTVPLALVLTNMSSTSGSRPFIDPAGYATKAMSSLTFDYTNSLGVATHDEGNVFDQDCNPADMNHTTNWFECLDVALTLGTNHIGIHAVDWAGNVTTTNFSYIFDTNGDTTPPAMTLTWPLDDMEISGGSFTLRGMLDDDTATVSGQWIDTNGVTNMVSGEVERGGQYWLENLPLYPGTNGFTITATDAAGNVTMTNLSLIQSAVTLTMDTVDADQLNKVRVNVTGEISEPTYAVWVNGVQGYNNGDGTWGATNVPVTAGGTASFDLTAYPPAYAPTDGSWTNFAVENPAYPNPLPADPVQGNVSWDKPPVVYVQTLSRSFSEYVGWSDIIADQNSTTENWSQGAGGSLHSRGWFTNNYGIYHTNSADLNWVADAGLVPSLPMHYDYTEYTNGAPYASYDGDSTSYYGFPFRVDLLALSGFEHIAGNGVYDNLAPYYTVPPTWSDTVQYVVKLFTGGKALRQGKSLFVLSQSLDWAARDEYDGVEFEDSGSVPSEQIVLDAQGTLNASSGTLTNVLANGKNIVITPRTTKSYSLVSGGLPGQSKYTLHILQDGNDVTDSNVTAIVGQQINLTCGLVASDGSTPPAITNFQWMVPGITFSDYVASAESAVLYTDFLKTTNQVNYYWVDGGSKQVSCDVTVAGETLKAQATFNVLRPTAQIITTGGQVSLDTSNDAGLRLHCGVVFAQVGILFDVTNLSVPSQFAGNTNITWIQMAIAQNRQEQTDAGAWYQKRGTNLCDGGVALGSPFPYGFDDTFRYPITTDSPQSRNLADKIAVNYSDTFDMWLMYQPNGGKWVPLQKVTWHWDGVGNWNGTNWVMTSHTDPGNPSGSDTTVHPTWTGNNDDLTWQPE
jgi:hypothetical protein